MRRDYPPQERGWAKRIVRLLSPEQRKRYVAACRVAPRCHNGRLYDADRARIAERILYEDRMRA